MWVAGGVSLVSFTHSLYLVKFWNSHTREDLIKKTWKIKSNSRLQEIAHANLFLFLTEFTACILKTTQKIETT